MSNNPSNKKEALNRGIRSLLGSIDSEMKNPAGTLKSEVIEQATAVSRIPLEDISPNAKQPRQDFDAKALEELAQSIRLHDIIQPLTVTKLPSGKYKLIAGERRWRAAKLAGIKDVPVYLRVVDDKQILELGLLENLQRENLNAIEIGLSYQRLIDECAMTQEEVATRMGMDRSTVSNYIRMLKLPPDIVVAVRNGSLSMGHARALINAGEVDKQLYVYNTILSKKLSVRQTEDLVKQLYKPSKGKVDAKQKPQGQFNKIQDQLTSFFGTKVKLEHQKTGRGKISLEYYSLEELNGLLEKMNVNIH
ncbi:MAG: ParB/RepB/Spo0J family partition protein [Chitinophagaceae bacterium]|jgi:ParB family chromosome partitioning protein|nr:ParB/RepB/Spo0J family partition protein [Chitinophagaceae bacterium]